MNKADLAAAARRLHGGITGAESVRIVDAVFRSVADGLVRGAALRIRGFGSLEVRLRRPRGARLSGGDPRAGRPGGASASPTPFFRPSRTLVRSLEP